MLRAGIKRAYVESGFKEILEELWKEKKNKVLTRESIEAALRDLKDARGYDLSPTEKMLFDRVVREKKNVAKPVFHRTAPKHYSLPPIDIPDPTFDPVMGKRTPHEVNYALRPMPFDVADDASSFLPGKVEAARKRTKLLSGKNLLRAGGAAAALAALGLVGAKVHEKMTEY